MFFLYILGKILGLDVSNFGELEINRVLALRTFAFSSTIRINSKHIKNKNHQIIKSENCGENHDLLKSTENKDSPVYPKKNWIRDF